MRYIGRWNKQANYAQTIFIAVEICETDVSHALYISNFSRKFFLIYFSLFFPLCLYTRVCKSIEISGVGSAIR